MNWLVGAILVHHHDFQSYYQWHIGLRQRHLGQKYAHIQRYSRQKSQILRWE